MHILRQAPLAFIVAALMNQEYVQGSQLKHRLSAQIDAQNLQQNQQQWGFLKNIVNIDRFFAGPDLAEVSGEKAHMQTKKKAGSGHTLSQTKSKSKADEDEEGSNNDSGENQEDSQQVATSEAQTAEEMEQVENQNEARAETESSTTAEAAVQVEAQEASSKFTLSKKAQQDIVRNEGLHIKHSKDENSQEVDLEIDEEGAAQKIAEEGAHTIQNSEEFNRLEKLLSESRAKPENMIGETGFKIDLKDPQNFQNKINLVVLPNPEQMSSIAIEKFDTKDQKQAQTAAEAMQMVLQSDTGATIISDDQPGKESIVENSNSDQSKYNSWIAAGYSIRNNFEQKMAPGDHQFHTVNWQPNNKINGYRSFPNKQKAKEHYDELHDQPKLLISGETGDVIESSGTEQEIDECLGNFYSARYNGKYYGQT